MRLLFALLVLTGLGSFLLQSADAPTAALKPKTVQSASITQKAPETAATPAVAPAQVAPVAQAAPAPVATPAPVTYSHEDLMSAAGIAPSDYGAVDYIVSHESGWRYWATEPTTFAYGECQSLPGSKMATAGADWQTNPVTQLKWCNAYAQARYGGWWAAQAYWAVHRNW